MNIFQEIGIAILVYFVVLLSVGLKGHKIKTRMKQFGNGIVWLGAIILFLYMILLGSLLAPKVAILIQESLLEYNFKPDAVLMLRGLLFAFIIMVFVAVIWFARKAFTFNPFKFNEEEKEFIKGENTMILSKIGKVFGLKKKEKKE